MFSISHPSSRSVVFSTLADQPPRFDPLNLGSNSGGGPRGGGDRREREKEEYGRGVAATKFCVEQKKRERGTGKEKEIYTYPTRAAPRAGEEDLNFKFYLIIFEFNFVTCPEGGSRPRQQSWRYSRAYTCAHWYIIHGCAHCIGVYLVAKRAVGGFFLLHPAEEDVRDLRVGLFATNLVKAAR